MRAPENMPRFTIAPLPPGVLLTVQYVPDARMHPSSGPNELTADRLDDWVNREIRQAYCRGYLDARNEVRAALGLEVQRS